MVFPTKLMFTRKCLLMYYVLHRRMSSSKIQDRGTGMKTRRKKIIYIIACVFLLVLLSSPELLSAQEFPDCHQCHTDKDTKKNVHPAVSMGCVTCHVKPHLGDSKFPKFLSAEGADLCWGCHDKTSFEKKVIHSPVASGGCTMCHDVHSSDNEKLLLFPVPDLCTNCHGQDMFSKETQHPPVAGGMCLSCHNPHASDSPKLLTDAPPQLCFNCHQAEDYIDKNKKIHHPPVESGLCMECHDAHSSPERKLLRAPMPGICFRCHIDNGFKGKFKHAPVEAGMCTNCHNPHQSDEKKLLLSPSREICFNCHDKSPFIRRIGHPPATSGLCDICHDPHSSPNVFQLHAPVNKLCLRCHPRVAQEPHATGSFGGAFGHPLGGRPYAKSKTGELSCASCHDPHSSDSIRLFRFEKIKKTADLCKNCHPY